MTEGRTVTGDEKLIVLRGIFPISTLIMLELVRRQNRKQSKHGTGEQVNRMDDLISRQAAIDALHMHLMYRMGTDSNKKRLDDWINGVPSAQPEIIYCKDCKWSDWYDAADGHKYCYCMETGEAGRTADDFCSYAERLEE